MKQWFRFLSKFPWYLINVLVKVQWYYYQFAYCAVFNILIHKAVQWLWQIKLPNLRSLSIWMLNIHPITSQLLIIFYKFFLNYILNPFSLIESIILRIINYLQEDYFTNICWIGNFVDSWIKVNDIRRLLLRVKVRCDSLLSIEIKRLIYMLFTCYVIPVKELLFKKCIFVCMFSIII